MSSERTNHTRPSSIPIEVVQVNEDPLTEIILERGLPREVNLPFTELTDSLMILTHSSLSGNKNHEEVANSLGFKFQRDSFDECLKILYHLFETEDHHSLLEKAIKHKIIPAFPQLEEVMGHGEIPTSLRLKEVPQNFSPEEWRALRLVTLGFEIYEIGEELGVSWKKAGDYARTAVQKLSKNQTGAAIVAMREGWVDPVELEERLGNRSVEKSKEQFGNLTPREKEIAAIIGTEGVRDKEIVERLLIATQTVKNHIVKILKKLDLRNRTEIAIFFFLYGDKLDEDEIIQPEIATPQPQKQESPTLIKNKVPAVPRVKKRKRRRRVKTEQEERRIEERRERKERKKRNDLRIMIALLSKGLDIKEIKRIVNSDPEEIREVISDLYGDETTW